MNSCLDKLVRVEVRIGHRSWPAFRVCGGTGLALAIMLMMTLAALCGLSLPAMAGLVGADLSVFLVLAMVTNIILCTRENLDAKKSRMKDRIEALTPI